MDDLGYLGSYTIAAVLYVIIFGLVGWVIGERKGRAGAGFLFGALLGPIGWIIILVGPDLSGSDLTAADLEATRSASQLRKCPFCAELVQPEAILCKHCGKTIEAVVVSDDEKFERWKQSRAVQTSASRPPAPEKAVDDLSIPCPKCGQRLKVSTLKQGENWCTFCFEKFIAE